MVAKIGHHINWVTKNKLKFSKDTKSTIINSVTIKKEILIKH